jgi:D-hydroxyproline dehydrogenase subunit alpha
MAAAGAAADSGQRVLLIDRRPRLGGNVWHPVAGATPLPESLPSLRRLDRENVEVVTGAEVLDRPAPSTLLIGWSDTARPVRYRQLVLATGARERFLPFPGWTLPNVTGAGALQLLAKAGTPVKGRSVVVAGSGPLLLAAAAYLREQGAEIRLIAEQASRQRVWTLGASLWNDRARLRQALELRRKLRGVPYRAGCWPVRAEGNGCVERVTLLQGRHERTVSCDLLACGFHLVPNTELAELLGCRMEAGFVVVDEFQSTSVPGTFCAGEPVGIGGLELARVEGEVAGLAATQQHERARELFAERRRLARFRVRLNRAFALNPELRKVVTAATTVCRCEDVRAEVLTSFQSGREARLMTRCGMGPCQGRVCGPSTEFLWGWNPRGVRPPIVPATVGQLTLTAEIEGVPAATP